MNLLAQTELRRIAVVAVMGAHANGIEFDETRAPDISGLISVKTPEFSAGPNFEIQIKAAPVQ
jgi:hypothetical protein